MLFRRELGLFGWVCGMEMTFVNLYSQLYAGGRACIYCCVNLSPLALTRMDTCRFSSANSERKRSEITTCISDRAVYSLIQCLLPATVVSVSYFFVFVCLHVRLHFLLLLFYVWFMTVKVALKENFASIGCAATIDDQKEVDSLLQYYRTSTENAERYHSTHTFLN